MQPFPTLVWVDYPAGKILLFLIRLITLLLPVPSAGSWKVEALSWSSRSLGWGCRREISLAVTPPPSAAPRQSRLPRASPGRHFSEPHKRCSGDWGPGGGVVRGSLSASRTSSQKSRSWSDSSVAPCPSHFPQGTNHRVWALNWWPFVVYCPTGFCRGPRRDRPLPPQGYWTGAGAAGFRFENREWSDPAGL